MVAWTQQAILYGGTFDPPHRGHEACIRLAHQRFPEAPFFIVPAYIPPVGAGQIKQPVASFEHRLAMCHLAFQGLVPARHLHISDIEANLPTPSYTLQTIEALMHSSRQKVWSLLIGGDQLDNFATWHRVHELLKFVNLLVVDRDPVENSMARNIEQRLQKLASDLQIPLRKLARDQYQWEHDGAKSIFFWQDELSPAASRIIRQGQRAAGYKGEWLASPVKDYICQNKLYQISKPSAAVEESAAPSKKK